jgi:glycosyltransferase involved in cell wall biosynthesis
MRKVANLYVGLSEYTVRLLLDLGLPRNKIIVLPNAVDTNTFKPSVSKEENTVLYAARINQEKGLDVLLEALFHLDIQTHLVIIGPVGNKSFFVKIERLMRKVTEETSHKVTYLGHVDKGTLIDWHRKASVFVCPSVSDHFPISILEAMACGTPVVGTNVGAIPEVIENGVNGILAPPNDSKALAVALEELLADKKKRETYGENARRIVEKNFSWQTVIGRLIQTYANLAQ